MKVSAYAVWSATQNIALALLLQLCWYHLAWWAMLTWFAVIVANVGCERSRTR